METLDDTLLVTAAGYKELEQELLELTADRRRQMSERCAMPASTATSPTTRLSSSSSKSNSSSKSRIAALSEKLAAAQVAAAPADGRAGVGSAVRVRHLDSGDVAEYELVGTIEPGVGHRRVSVGAPVGHALLGHRPGARVEVAAPCGRLTLELLSVRHADSVEEAA